jgi:hypothetical protein
MVFELVGRMVSSTAGEWAVEMVASKVADWVFVVVPMSALKTDV